MAHMIPPEPKDFDKRSHEGDVFNALSKLSDEYYVFHSVTPVGFTSEDEFYEREVDFVVANRKKGVVAIEVKAGNNLRYENRTWKYTSGRKMSHNGPYHQAATAKRALMNKILNHDNEVVRELYGKCKFMHAVFFPEFSEESFKLLEGLPEECDLRITLLAEDLPNPSPKLSEMFSAVIPGQKYNTEDNQMSEEDFMILLNDVLCPHFDLIPTPKARDIAIEERMNQLLREQCLILNFLDEQQVAVINGAAGTGKTMIATEKARRHSCNGEKVLFLCYNRLLCEQLIRDYKESEVSRIRKEFACVEFMTLSMLAKKVTGDYKNYDDLLLWLLECGSKQKNLGYQHIIVDEGQDFGLVDAQVSEENFTGEENVSIIDALQEAAIANDGTFYLFYDKYQMIQGGGRVEYVLPDCIENSDCKLSLHCNCRNTKEIARTSVTPLKDKKKRTVKTSTACVWEEPIEPVLHLADDNESVRTILDQVLTKLEEIGVKETIILTPGAITESCVYECSKKSTNPNDAFIYYMHGEKEYRVTTCIKYKGLEADAIVMIDLSKKSFEGEKAMEFYVGTSRAKRYLDMIGVFADDELKELAQSLDENAPVKDNPKIMRRVLGNIFASVIE